MQKYIYDQTHVAVERWAEHHSNIIENMQFSSAAAWKSVKILSAGQSSHLKQVRSMSLEMPDGSLAKNDKDNAAVLGPHFNKVFNNQREVDWSVLDELTQYTTIHELARDISYAEFDIITSFRMCMIFVFSPSVWESFWE